MQAVKLYTNIILQFLMGGGVVLYNGYKMVVGLVVVVVVVV